jgi:UDP-GlcNAc3NAcA epimerase
MKILTIVGARPQFVKAAVISRELRKEKKINEVIVHTGQHFDANMSSIFFSELEIPKPHYNLGVKAVSNSEMTAKMIPKLAEVMKKESPDLVLVYGDTNSTLAAALAAKYNCLKLAHVEAGMRSFNMKMPEEVNRIVTDRLSDILFCSSETAVGNLVREGIEHMDCEVILSGDVMYDAALYYGNIAEKSSDIIRQFGLEEYILVTLHRTENVDNKESLLEICDALNEINKSTQIVLPLHPRTEKRLKEAGIKLSFETMNPVGYLDMIQLVKNCRLVMTDSGGLQKEAFYFKKNCITLRNETEWTELVMHGFNILAGADAKKILEAFEDMTMKDYVFKMQLYGNGCAGEKIVDFLKRNLNY